MSEDTARLQIRVDSSGATQADAQLDNLAKSGARAERATDGLTGSFLKFAGPAAVVAGTIASLNKLTAITREFDVLNAGLITATGSAEKAAIAFQAIQDFAINTPYDLQQATNGFTQLVNLGLEPSEAAMMSYGNTAAAMGKNLSQMINAVADAATGEFERLKEFGIRSKNQGDTIDFTFRGVTTTVRNNSKEIEGYLQALGNNEFAGSMVNRMETLDGAISNLEDQWNQLFLVISQEGVGGVIEESVRQSTEALSELTDFIASGQLEGYMKAIGASWGDTWDTIVDNLESAYNFYVGILNDMGLKGESIIGILGNSFLDLPQNFKDAFNIIQLELEASIQRMAAGGKALAEAINPFSDNSWDNAWSEYADVIEDVNAQLSRGYAEISVNRSKVTEGIESEISAADELRKKYDEAAGARRNSGEDRLAQFYKGADPSATGETESKAAAKAREAREKEFDNLVKSLQTDEEAIQDSYNRRLDIILKNTEEGSKKQADLKAKLDKEFSEQALGELAQPDTYDEQIEYLNNFYERRKELILENVQLTEDERTALEEELTTQRNEKLALLEQNRTSMILAQGESMFGGLSSLAKVFAGEQSTLYKTLFATSKAFAVADATIKGVQAVQKAWAEVPYPANIAAAATAGFTAAGNVATIVGTNFAGGYDVGGSIPSGKVGLVGEYGPELIEGPARITSRNQTMERIRNAEQTSKENNSPAPVNRLTVNPAIILDSDTLDRYFKTPEGEQTIVDIMQRNQGAA